MDIKNKELHELFELANKIGNKRYHKLTQQDFENYRKFDYWRYINGDYECGTTQDSKDWVIDNSDGYCPICEQHYSVKGGKTIDHKLPRSHYPWLSIDFKNLWVICRACNQEKSEMNWFEYEHYIFIYHPELYLSVKAARPTLLIKSLKN
ncbi:hypothetical protein NIES2111_32770 [Nostoc sp. NIES-2111]|nr:hypothetical protein NIES2111_32770 [Nostoc sp. NIES-2111]